MKKTIGFFAATLVLITTTTFAQTNMKEYKAGHVFSVSLPDYMTKTYGINSASTLQFKNSLKDVAGFIIVDTKEDLILAEMPFSSINDFYDNFINNFLINETNRNVSDFKSQTIGENKFMECDATYFDNDSKLDIYYFVGIAETKNAFYKVLCFGTLENKDKFKADFQKILYSVKD